MSYRQYPNFLTNSNMNSYNNDYNNGYNSYDNSYNNGYNNSYRNSQFYDGSSNEEFPYEEGRLIPGREPLYRGQVVGRVIDSQTRYPPNYNIQSTQGDQSIQGAQATQSNRYNGRYSQGYTFNNDIDFNPYASRSYNGRSSTFRQIAQAGAGTILASQAGRSMQRVLNQGVQRRPSTPEQEARYQQARQQFKQEYDQTLEEKYGWRPNLYE